VLVPLVAVHNSIVLQMDVKVAFFYGELEEEIYMDKFSLPGSAPVLMLYCFFFFRQNVILLVFFLTKKC